MNLYIKAIGFEQVDSDFEEQMIHAGILDSLEKGLVIKNNELNRGAVIVRISESTGLYIYGRFKDKEFIYEYYFPFVIGRTRCDNDEITIERHLDKESYAVVCDESKTGVTLIFYLQNVPQYLKEKQLSGNKMNYTSVTLAGLCESGTILLPVKKNHSQKERQREEVYNRMQLLSAAKSGDPNAIETLTLEDIDTYSKVSRRLVTEDVFSIVDTYIMPYSVECDRYSILGEIQELHEIVNEYTGENVYVMKLDVNGLVFDVCVPRQRLLGEPAVGRRFKANMWLQGYINY